MPQNSIGAIAGDGYSTDISAVWMQSYLIPAWHVSATGLSLQITYSSGQEAIQQDMRIAVYSGGTLTDPTGATLVEELIDSTLRTDGDTPTFPLSGNYTAGQPLWIVAKSYVAAGTSSGRKLHHYTDVPDWGPSNGWFISSSTVSNDPSIAYPATWPTEPNADGGTAGTQLKFKIVYGYIGPVKQQFTFDVNDELLTDISVPTYPSRVYRSWGISYNTKGLGGDCPLASAINTRPINVSAINMCAVGSTGLTLIQLELAQQYVLGDTVFEFGQTYGLGAVLVYRPLHQAYQLTAGVIDTTLVEVSVHQTYYLDAPYIAQLREFSLGQGYNIVGQDWSTELLGYVNDHRVGLGLIPIEGVWVADSVDIAQGHSVNMADTEIFAHESYAYPAGWQLVSDRMGLLSTPLPATALLENLIGHYYNPAKAISNGEDPDDTSTPWGPISAYDAFNTWKNSTGHNAVMLHDWAVEDHPFMGIGMVNSSDAYYGAGADTSYITTYLTQIFIAYGIPLGVSMATFELGQTYALKDANIYYISQTYDLNAYKNATKQHYSYYDVSLSVSHRALFSYNVARQHAAPVHYSITVPHTTYYSGSTGITKQSGSSYDIDAYARVNTQHTATYSIALSASHSTQYGIKPYVSATHTGYYNILHSAGKQHISKYSASYSLSTQHGSLWDLSIFNAVHTTHKDYWTLKNDAVYSLQSQAVLTIGGMEVPILECIISTAETEALWSCKVVLESLNHYGRFTEGALFTIDLQGDIYHFQYDSKEINRQSPASVVVTLSGLSPAMTLAGPRATGIERTYSVDTSARAIVEDVLGQAVTWAMPDWVIPKYRVAVQNAIPLDFVSQLLKSAGGLIESNIDGSLLVRSKYLVNIPDYPSVAVGHTYSDDQDNLSMVESYELRSGYNKFRVTDAEGSTQDRVEFILDEGSSSSGKLNIYPSPWRTSILVRTTDNSGMVYIGNDNWLTRQETDTVEFTKGEASLRYPAELIDSIDWHSEALGGIIHTAHTTGITAGTQVNQGYGLATVVYTVRFLEYTTTAVPDSSVQYVIEDI